MPDQNGLADLLGNMGDAAVQATNPGLITDQQAKLMGKPEWAGMNRENLRLMLDQPKQEERIADEKKKRELIDSQIEENRARTNHIKKIRDLDPKDKARLQIIKTSLREKIAERNKFQGRYTANTNGFRDKIDNEIATLHKQQDKIVPPDDGEDLDSSSTTDTSAKTSKQESSNSKPKSKYSEGQIVDYNGVKYKIQGGNLVIVK